MRIGKFSLTSAFSVVISMLILLLSCKNGNQKFTQVSSSVSNIDFTNEIKERDGLSILYYLYFYNGGGVATGDINNDGLIDIYFTANSKGSNKLYLNKGNFVFEDITKQAGVAGISDWCSGVTMADVNADGLLDIYVSTVSNKYGLKGHNELYINKGENVFEEQSEKYNLNTACFSTQSVFFDYDRDGDLDCFILNQSHKPHSNVINVVNRNVYDSLSGDRLYRNDLNATGKFTDVSANAGIFQSNLGYGLGVAIADLNNDGWDDIYVGNDFHENDYYYVNNQNGTFSEMGSNHFRHYSRFSMGNDVADYNNDGQLDLITVDMLPKDEKILKTYGSDENMDIYNFKIDRNGYQKQFSKNVLQTNNGNGISFTDNSILSGVSATDWSWAPLFADFDNDGKKDLFISSGIVKRPVDLDYVQFVSDMKSNKGLDITDKFDQEVIDKMPDGASHPFLFKGDGKMEFTDVSEDWGIAKLKGYFTGSSYADLNNDGLLDLVINPINAPAVILKNIHANTNHLAFSFKGNNANTFGIGAKVYLFQGAELQYQQLMLTRGFQSSSTPFLHFGLADGKLPDSILVIWPNQQYQVIKSNIKSGLMKVDQINAKGNFVYNEFFKKQPSDLTNITNQVNLNWQHKENDFIDQNRQYLIPHKQSTRGPKLTVADINKDGLDDFFVCGASEQPNVIMIQKKDGGFSQLILPNAGMSLHAEKVDANFFDANKDGYPDLYIVSGGNQYDDGNPALLDHFYLNDKKGGFMVADSLIPSLAYNKSSLTHADYDKDGDIDLFVTGLANAKMFGIPQSSYLLLNDGNGKFSLANKNTIDATALGIATSSTTIDFNKDGWQDIVVTGEWMNITLFENAKGKFIKKEIAGTSGLWQSVFSADINGDGYIDFFAGNWGENSKLNVSKNNPLKLYIKDFDSNGSVEQILCYTREGKEYTFLAKDELERALPVLKKAYLKYSEVAGKTVQYMFYDLFKDYQELKVETLSTSYFINDTKGGFIQHSLPKQLQLAPVFSFTSLSNGKLPLYLACGNFYGVIPYEGQYDGLYPTAFSIDKQLVSVSKENSFNELVGEFRDAKWIMGKDGKKILVISRNNNSLLFFQ
ncbi:MULTISPECIES: FG-GAP-like repeat-containing protein [Sediminibacterium]|uniref:FG-GAP-like repeat-containing protein n=1 Tax=Sediminibacterium TaxID=504481 RepID=UPI000405DB1E|nr:MULTISPECIES: FG-GAP-like repeat-containing protein [Sediminibacterium]